MKIRRLTDTGDIMFGKGDDTFIEADPKAIEVCIKERFLMMAGSFWLDEEAGNPIFVDGMGKEMIDTLVRERLLATEGVASILDFESTEDRETRKYKCQVKLETDYGVSDMEIEI